MKKLNQFLLASLTLTALLMLLPALVAASPLWIFVLVFFGWGSLRQIARWIWQILTSFISLLVGIIIGILSGFFRSFHWLFMFSINKTRFMSWGQRLWLFGSHQNGFLVDGHSKRLSEQSSYESLLIQGGMGRGKSSIFVMPNLLKLPKSHPSFVITDTSGEVYQNTSGYLASQGYVIKVLNLMDLRRSETYNPLGSANTPQKMAEFAKILVSASSQRNGGKAADPFWEQSAEKLIRILGQCLHNQPDAKFCNLANLRHLVTSFDAHIAPKGQLGKIDRFVLSATQNDPSTFASYQAFVQGNLKTIQSVLMSADVALDPIGTPEVAALTAINSLDLSGLRKRKMVLYIIVNQTQMQLYAYLLNLLYADLFKTLLVNHNNPGRPVWLFLDEFGHLQIPDFEIFATTSRKYKVSFALFLQSTAQLESRYGALNARTIVEALGTEIYLPGMGLPTARELEARLGRRKRSSLMSASDIIRMKNNRALMMHSNRLPVMLKTKRYFEQRTLNSRAKLTPAQMRWSSNKPPKLIQL